MRLDLFFDFALHRVQIESSRRLHWRKVDSRFRQVPYPPPLYHLRQSNVDGPR